MNKRSLKLKFAFTLVELMVAVVIVGVLAAIGTVSYGKIISRSRIAEGYVQLEAVSKAESTYYVQHKEFRTLEFNPGSSSIPTGGQKVPMLDLPSWSDVGGPIAPGTNVSFSMVGFAGKTNSSGTPIVTNMSPGVWTGTVNYMWSTAIAYSGYLVGNTYTLARRCAGIQTNPYLALNFTPQKNWIFILATGDLKVDETITTDNINNGIKCTRLFKVLETDSKGTIISTPGTMYLGE